MMTNQPQIKAFVERIERLNDEKADIQEAIKEVFAEAKADGYDTKTIREVIKLRRLSEAERQEREALLELYMNALGMLADTPLGEAALQGVSVTLSPREEVADAN
jgi:uncharacterized protein (UPF0335 family)